MAPLIKVDILPGSSGAYHIAIEAQTKLEKEASRAVHNLRRLVAHANLLDTIAESIWEDRAPQQETPFDDAAVATAAEEKQGPGLSLSLPEVITKLFANEADSDDASEDVVDEKCGDQTDSKGREDSFLNVRRGSAYSKFSSDECAQKMSTLESIPEDEDFLNDDLQLVRVSSRR